MVDVQAICETQNYVIEMQRVIIENLLSGYSKEPGFVISDETQRNLQEVNMIILELNSV